MDKSNWKVFRLNECDSVAAPDFESAVKFYLEVTGLSKDDAIDESYAPYERSLNETIYIAEEELTDEERALPLERELVEDVNYVQVSFERMLKHSDATKPYLIASYEY